MCLFVCMFVCVSVMACGYDGVFGCLCVCFLFCFDCLSACWPIYVLVSVRVYVVVC